MIGQTIAHYKITAKLGEGGMGEVYLATDTKLDRQVALKFLPASLQSDAEARERLIREAKSASKLNHPNILTIHSVDAMNGRDFIVMEYVDGKNLSEYLASRTFTLEDRLSIAIQVAEGLGKAHTTGVIHRDVKPSNVLIDSEGRPKLLDFGLATFRGATKLTQTGSTIGTAAYMSPEQASSRECDHRSDLFSFGVMLYEMIAGRLPFEGTHNAALLYSIVNDEPAPLTRFVTGVPDELQRIVSKLLAKRPNERYQSASDLIADLRRLMRQSSSDGTPVAGVRRKMLAVLPFENLGLAEDEYFADGITEEIISRLASVGGLGVISRTSAMQYKGTKKSIREIGSELSVDYILEGTVRWGKSSQGPSRVRITPQLIHVNDDTHLWADRYDRVIEDIFDVQSEIAEKVTGQLNIKLADPEKLAIDARPTENIDAYHAYLRGLEYVWRTEISAEICQIRIQMFERACGLDPQFAQAHAQASIAHADMYWYGHDRTSGRATKAKLAAERASALKRDDAETPLALGFYHYRCESDFAVALTEFLKSVERQPNHSVARFMVSMCQRRQGQFTESLECSRQVLKLDPLRAVFFAETGITAAVMRRFDEADKLLDHSISLAPDQSHAHGWKFHVALTGRGDIARARHALEICADERRYDNFREWYELLLAERNLDAVLAHISGMREPVFEEQYWYLPQALLRAEAHTLLGDASDSHADYEAALRVLEAANVAAPGDPRIKMALAGTLIGLGRLDDAFRNAQSVVSTEPVSHDTMARPLFEGQLAMMNASAGRHEDALAIMERVLSSPSHFSPGHLRVMPHWDSLRGNPRFEELAAQQPKDF